MAASYAKSYFKHFSGRKHWLVNVSLAHIRCNSAVVCPRDSLEIDGTASIEQYFSLVRKLAPRNKLQQGT